MAYFCNNEDCVIRENFQSVVPVTKFGVFLDEILRLKKGTKREKAIESIVQALTNSAFKSSAKSLENNVATFLYRSLNLLKRGSLKELQSSSQAIGLLAMITDDRDDANEIYRDVLPVVSEALKSKPKTLKVIDCLAVSTFFGASSTEETQAAMQVIWAFICPQSESEVSNEKHLPDVQFAAISAWLFLLSRLERWGISSKYWQGTISYFLSLLESDDQAVSALAGAVLALIFETECVDKFVSKQEQISGESSTPNNTYSSLKEAVKDRILEKVERLCLEQKAADNVCKDLLCVLDYFKDGCFPKFSTSIGTGTLVVPSWSKMIQLNYLKSFLGNDGFKAHMLENQNLQAIFGFKEIKVVRASKEFYEPIRDEGFVNYYAPKERDFSMLFNKDIKKDRSMRGALLDKAQTKLRNKRRGFAMERKMAFCLED